MADPESGPACEQNKQNLSQRSPTPSHDRYNSSLQLLPNPHPQRPSCDKTILSNKNLGQINHHIPNQLMVASLEKEISELGNGCCSEEEGICSCDGNY
jgi:hypothetical protein